MIGKLFLLFAVVPFVELALLIRLGGWVGFWPTLGLVIASGAVGAFLARTQGARVLNEIRSDLAAGRMPADKLLDGLMILVGGVLLLTPGFLSDLAGMLLLLPFTRSRFKRGLAYRLEQMVRSGQVNVITVMR